MSEEKTEAIAGSTATPATIEERKKTMDTMAEGVGLPLLKELTDAILSLSREIRDLRESIEGAPAEKEGEEDQPGLTDLIDELRDVVASLDVHQVGMNIHLTRYAYAFDKMVEIQTGDAEAQPPVAARVPTLQDWIAAIAEFEKRLEEEDKAEAEAEKTAAAAGQPPLPEKPPMMANGAQAKPALPPLPSVPSRPGRELPPLPVVKPK